MYVYPISLSNNVKEKVEDRQASSIARMCGSRLLLIATDVCVCITFVCVCVCVCTRKYNKTYYIRFVLLILFPSLPFLSRQQKKRKEEKRCLQLSSELSCGLLFRG
ncbi:hypothetical protein F4810DRAFT_395524 [Camillea tinctor]|nr:hypothetical protein F4810DRAFT_395524 [Camillea tinctor]